MAQAMPKEAAKAMLAFFVIDNVITPAGRSEAKSLKRKLAYVRRATL